MVCVLSDELCNSGRIAHPNLTGILNYLWPVLPRVYNFLEEFCIELCYVHKKNILLRYKKLTGIIYQKYSKHVYIKSNPESNNYFIVCDF